MREIKKAIILFLVGAFGYCALEILSRGYTHWSMGLTGGVCLIAIEAIYTKFAQYFIVWRAMAAALLVTAAELIVGLVVNVWLKLEVWSYAHEPLNFLGQICAKYTIVWFALCLTIMAVLKAVQLVSNERKKARQ